MSHRDTIVCCAEVPGADEDTASRTLSALEEWRTTQSPGSFQKRRMHCQKKAAFHHVAKVAFPGVSWIAWLGIQIIVRAIIRWWFKRNFETSSDAAVVPVPPDCLPGSPNASGSVVDSKGE